MRVYRGRKHFHQAFAHGTCLSGQVLEEGPGLDEHPSAGICNCIKAGLPWKGRQDRPLMHGVDEEATNLRGAE